MGQARRARVVSGALLVALLVAACTPVVDVEAVDPNGELTTFMGGDPGNSDPQRLTSLSQVRVALLTYEGLLRLDPKTLRPVPGAARELPAISADGLTYRFTLRDGLTYSDGSRLVAADFAYALSRLCEPGAAGYAPLFNVIVGCQARRELSATKDTAQRLKAARDDLFTGGIRVKSDSELELVLREPAAYLSSLLATWLSAPVRERDVARGSASWYMDAALYIGNGPFVLAERVRDERLVFVANPRARVPPKLKKWTIWFGSTDAAVGAYRHDEGDVVEVTPEDVALLSDAALRAEILESPAACTVYVRFNAARPPFDDPKVRLALAKGIDRTDLLADLGTPTRPLALSLIPPGLPGHDPGDTAQRFDPDAARKLLAESRYTNVRSLTWTYLGSNATVAKRIGALVRQWKTHLGIDVAPEPLDTVTLTDRARRPETRSIMQFNTWCADYPDQHNWLSTVFRSTAGINPSFAFVNPKFDDLVGRADREGDPTKRDDLYREASRLASEDGAAIWLWYGTQLRLQKPWVRGLNVNTLDPGGLLGPGDVYVTRKRR